MNIDIVKLLEKSESIVDLEERLTYEGKKFNSIHEFSKYLQKEWMSVQKEKLLKIVKKEYSDNIPLKVVKHENIEYNLYGIVHGATRGKLSMTKELKNHYIRSINKMSGWGSEIQMYCEEDFPQILDANLREIKDITNNISISLPKQILLGMLAPVLYPVLFTIQTYAYYKINRRVKDSETDLENLDIKLHIESLKSAQGQNRHFEFYQHATLPEPFALEMEHAESKTVNHKFLYLLMGRSGVDSPSVRSKYMAKRLSTLAGKKYGKDRYKRIDFLCGSGHVSQIEYFVKNPNYSFDHINTWVEKKKK